MALLRHQLNEKQVFKALTDEATFATVLHVIALVAYGPEIYHLDILELRERFSEDFHAELEESNESKLTAILMATSTDIFFEQPEAFRGICHTLVEGDPGVELMSDLTLPEALWGVFEMEINHGPGEFSPGVMKQIAACQDQEAGDSAETAQGLAEAMTEARGRLVCQLEDLGVETGTLPPVSISG